MVAFSSEHDRQHAQRGDFRFAHGIAIVEVRKD
jgi:hypothetical protein